MQTAHPELKLHRLYHFSQLRDHPELGGIWKTVGITFSTRDSNENKWKIRRVLSSAKDQEIGEERTVLEILLTNYCSEVKFHPMEPLTKPQAPEQKPVTGDSTLIEETLIQDSGAAFLIANATLRETLLDAEGNLRKTDPAGNKNPLDPIFESIRDSGIIGKILKKKKEPPKPG